MSNAQTIGNNYGAGLTVADVVRRYGAKRQFLAAFNSSAPNLAMRIFLASYGFNRVSRAFAAAVLETQQ